MRAGLERRARVYIRCLRRIRRGGGSATFMCFTKFIYTSYKMSFPLTTVFISNRKVWNVAVSASTPGVAHCSLFFWERTINFIQFYRCCFCGQIVINNWKNAIVPKAFVKIMQYLIMDCYELFDICCPQQFFCLCYIVFGVLLAQTL